MGNNICGIFWMLLAGLLMSCMVVLIKILGNRLPSFEIVFFRSLLQLIVLASVFIRIGFSELKTSRPYLQTIRALVAVILINCNFYAFTKLPVADVTAIGFSRNLFLVILAIPLLGEKINIHRLLATIIGFTGIIIIVRPGYNTMEGATLFALAGAGLGATMVIMIRKLTITDSNLVMMTFPSLAVVPATGVPTLLYWQTPTPGAIILLLAMAALGITGQWCMIQAFRLGEATAVAPAGYMRLLFATMLGFLFFKELPDLITFLGITIIVASNLYLIYREKNQP